MRLRSSVAAAVAVAAVVLASTGAKAQATRTWVSGVGEDANPCSRTQPCKTFGGAIAKTSAGGEINCLDPGGFGAVTITKSITIDCTGTLGSILAPGAHAVIINAGVNDQVRLRGLSLQGAGSGLDGVRVLAAAGVAIEDVAIAGFTGGAVAAQPASGQTTTVNIVDAVMDNVAVGVRLQPSGAARVFFTMARSSIDRAGTAVDAIGGGAGVFFTLVDDNITVCIDGVRLSTANGATVSGVLLRSTITLCSGTGVVVGAGTTLRIGDTNVVQSLTGFTNNGSALSLGGTNHFSGNTANTSGAPLVSESGQ